MFPKVSLLLLASFIAIGSPLHAQSESTSVLKTEEVPRTKPKWTADWRLTLGGATMTEGKDEAGAAFVWADAKFEYKPFEPVRFYLNPRFSGGASREQDRIAADEFESEFSFYDFYVGYSPVKFFEFRAGSFSQGFHKNSMLVSSLRSFPGMQQVFAANLGGDVKGRLIFQQVIPTSHTLNTEREEKESLPKFFTETAQLEGKHFGWLKWRATGGYFAWNDMPDKVIEESRLKGNLGYGDITPGSQFRFGHEGLFGSAEACYCADGQLLGGTFEYQRIRNTMADSMFADAQLVGVGPRLDFGQQVLDIRVRSYFIESDATVARYNKSRFGNTNREGINIYSELDFKDKGFKIFADIYQAKPIIKDTNQFDLAIYYLGVETDYASF